MAHGQLIRQHMADVDGKASIGGFGTAVEVDETLVGGVKRGKHMRGSAGKTVVVGALQRDGDIITAVAPNQRRVTLQPFVLANVKAGGELHRRTVSRVNRRNEAASMFPDLI